MAVLFNSLPLDVAAGVAVLLSLLYLYLTWTYDHWKRKGVPFVKPVLFFGSIKDFILGRLSDGTIFKQMYDAYDGHRFVGFYQFREPSILLRDLDLVKDMLLKNFTSFHDRGFPVDEENHPLSAHLFNLPGPRWRALRAKLTPTFTSGKMKMMYQLMKECSDELSVHLKEPAKHGEELEMREVMAQFTTDIIGSCAFGLQMNSMKDSNSEFRQMGRKAFEASLKTSLRRFAILFLPPVAKLLNLSFSGSEVDTFFLNAVKDTVSYREKNGIIRNDFMQLLIQLKLKGKIDNNEAPSDNFPSKDKADINMSDNLLAAQAFVFFLAGFETSSTLLSFALYELALNPDIQTRLRDEIDSVLENHGGNVTYEALQEMHYLDKVISEALRKYPPGGILMRLCTKPYIIPGTNVTVDEGTRVIVPVYALHHDPKYYPDPERFDPDRFNEEIKAARPHYAYLPFGEGPRICIGMRFGLLQAKLGLAVLLKDFQFTPSKKTVIPIEFDPTSFVTAPRGGIHLKISCRE